MHKNERRRMPMYAVGWGFAVIFFLLLEALTMGLTTIWFAAGAFVAAAVALFGCPFSVQIVAFVVVSVLCLVFTRPIAKRFLNDKTEKTNADSVIGCTGVVTEDIDNLLAKGQVLVKGQYWTARAEEDGKLIKEGSIIREGAKVTVKEISGVTLIVYPSAFQ